MTSPRKEIDSRRPYDRSTTALSQASLDAKEIRKLREEIGDLMQDLKIYQEYVTMLVQEIKVLRRR